MLFDAALVAQKTFRRAEAELDADWGAAVEIEDTFSSNAGPNNPSTAILHSVT
jgi:hypothetical protein